MYIISKIKCVERHLFSVALHIHYLHIISEQNCITVNCFLEINLLMFYFTASVNALVCVTASNFIVFAMR